MDEPRAGGAWFRWSALNPLEKTLAWISFGSLAVAVAISGSLMGLARNAHGIADRAETGGGAPGWSPGAARIEWLPGISQDAAAIAAAILIGISIVSWVMFSRRQDELFNRVQNRAYGLGSIITFGIMGLWLLLTRVAGVPAMSVEAVILAWWLVFTLIWFRETHRLWR